MGNRPVIAEVADDTYRFETSLSGLNRTLAAYFIRDDKPVLIDPGPASAIPQVQDAITRLGISDLSYIIPTHIHLDHAGSSGRLAEFFPRAIVIFHPSAVKHAIDPSRLIQGSKLAFGDDFERVWGTIAPVPEARIKAAVDGEELSLGSRLIKIIFAPGHAPHHIVIFDRKTGGLFAGEALGAPRKDGEFFPLPAIVPPFDLETYLETMKNLASLNPRLIFYAHDGVGKEPAKLIPKAAENTRLFGAIVLKALKEGQGVDEIGRLLENYVFTQTGVKTEVMEIPLTVEAYIYHFKKKGLI